MSTKISGLFYTPLGVHLLTHKESLSRQELEAFLSGAQLRNPRFVLRTRVSPQF
jgi:hypothetical protein